MLIHRASSESVLTSKLALFTRLCLQCGSTDNGCLRRFLAREQESAPQSSMQPGEPWYPHQSANQRARIPTEIFVDSKPLSAPRRMEGNVDGIEGRNNLGDERAQAMSWDETAQAQAMSWEAKTQNGLRLRGGLIVSDKSPYTVRHSTISPVGCLH
eukprot:2649795-Rhodomonas_salina.2